MSLRRRVGKALLSLLGGRRLPRTRGRIAIPGVDADVEIGRDRWGVPYITAQSATDAWFGLGFCQGQDRPFQVEMLRRLVRGEVSALVGEAALPVDRISRRIGFRRVAEAHVEATDPDIRAEVAAFARGVTLGMTRGRPRRSHELFLLRAQPSEFDVADSVGVLVVMSFAMAANWDSELARWQVLLNDGPEALRAVSPVYRHDLPVGAPVGERAGETLDRLADELALFQSMAGKAGCSNNWAIAPHRTSTGRPLLANDPHLAPLLPSHWYLARIATPNWRVAGACFAGTPGISVGHNGFAAWGVTAGLIDGTDLFLEDLSPEGDRVRRGDDWVPCEVREERIQVRGGADVIERVSITPRGPILSPVLKDVAVAMSLQAVWLRPNPTRGLLRAQETQSFGAFRKELANWPLLSMNVAYADASGDIAWQLTGEVPQRGEGPVLLPRVGWDARCDWTGIVPFDAMPYAHNPDLGFVATANQMPRRESDDLSAEAFLGADWVDGYRLARISEVLQSRSDWDADACARLQLDQQTPVWREVRDVVTALQSTDQDVTAAIALLREWDGVVAADSPAAALFELFIMEMRRRVVAAKSPKAARWILGRGSTVLVPRPSLSVRGYAWLAQLLQEQPPNWFAQSWSVEMLDALAGAARQLRRDDGDHRQGAGFRTWGEVRSLWFRHAMGRGKWLSALYNRGPFPGGGDANTVAQAAVDPFDPGANPLFVASLRAVIDVGNWDACRFALPGGQSGDVLSPHYDDQFPRWQTGGGIPIAWSEEAVEKAVVERLVLGAC